MNAKQTDA